MPVFSSKYPSQTVQQLNAVLAEETGRLGRVVYLTNESYTVDARDDLIVLAATTSTGNYTLTFPTTLPANVRCLVVMPAAPTGSDKYVTSGLGSVITFDAAGLTLGTLTLGGSTIAENSTAIVPVDPTLVLGDGTGSPSLTLNKSNTGTDSIWLSSVSLKRGSLVLDGSENVVLAARDAAEAITGSLTIDNATGVVSTSGNLTVNGLVGATSMQALAITALALLTADGGATINATAAKRLTITTSVSYADNAAALAGGLTAGMVYKTATGELRIVV